MKLVRQSPQNVLLQRVLAELDLIYTPLNQVSCQHLVLLRIAQLRYQVEQLPNLSLFVGY